MKKTILLSLGLVILLIVAACVIVIGGRLLYLDTYKDVIITTVEKALNRRVTYHSGSFSLRRGATFAFTKASVMEKDGSSAFVSTKRIDISIALLPLIEKKLVLKEVRLEEPDIKLVRFKNGKFNFSDILEGNKEGIPLSIRSIGIEKGSATFEDQAVSQQGVISTFNNIDLFVSRLIRGKSSIFRLSAAIPERSGQGKLVISGTAKLPPQKGSLRDTRLDINVTAANLDAGRYWDYYSRYVPFRKIYGSLDLDSSFKGTLSDFSSTGSAKINGLYFDYPQVFHSMLTPKEVRVKYTMELTPKDLIVKHLALDVDKLSVKGSCALKDIHSGDLFISAKASTNKFSLEEFGKYIPYGIIENDTSEFIEKRILGGTYKLQKGTLEGRVSQIAHMEKGTNYNVLFVKGTADGGVVSFGNGTPSFNNIRGNLELRGKDFILTGMEGRFGNSPFKLDGKIEDYPLQTPSKYPFTMTMTPARNEVLWLLDNKRTGLIGFNGPSTLNLSGAGNTSNYILSGKWDLSSSAYSYAKIFNKPAGQPNIVNFKGRIDGDEVNIDGIQYALRSMNLYAVGKYRLAGKNQLLYSINSNEFPIQDVTQMFQEIGKYNPRGKIKASIQGKLGADKTSEHNYHGNLFLSGFSIKPPGTIKYIENINGDLTFSNDMLSTTSISTKIGNSVVSGNGTLKGFKNPFLDVNFSSPSLDLTDVGFRGRTQAPPLRNVRGSIVLNNGNLHIRKLTCLFGKSSIDAQGTINNIKKPVVNIFVNSPLLDVDDLLALKGLDLGKKADETIPVISGKLNINAESGKFRQFAFDNLKTSLVFRDRSIHLEPTKANVAGGSLRASGLMDYDSAGKPCYRISFDMKNLSALRIQQSFDIKREVTGNISMDGDLNACGNNLQDVKKSLQGNLRIHSEDGSLRKFAVLSKIFSILNVSQLFKFQLPDMVSGGMPYNKMTGSFSIRNGVATTDNFYIDSDAINISAIGKFDLPEEKLDLTVGVKPLQTVDKLVSHLPIVGWVLTGKNKSLVTAYFEAKGSWDNPQVRAISLKSLAKGVFNIFKRVFQLPAKLFTDTGEVIINKPD